MPAFKNQKRKHSSKLIDDEPIFEPSRKASPIKFYFKCETDIGDCWFVISGINLDSAIKKLYSDCKTIRSIKQIKEKTIH